MERWIALGIAVFAASPPARAAPIRDYTVPKYAHSLTLGAGALGFVPREGAWTSTRAVVWTMTYAYSPATTVAWELAFSGATAPSQGNRQLLLGTAEGGLRINVVPLKGVYPFVSGGIGYGAYQRSRVGNNGLDLSTLTVPLGAGIEVLADSVTLQGRFVYRPIWFDDEVRFTDLGADSWQVTGAIGTRF